MKISTKGRYGLRAMIDIASTLDECVTLKSISERQGIPENYLEQIFSLIKKAKLIKSVRGSQGGYILNKPANEIKVGEILRCLENLKTADCISEEHKAACGTGDCDTCATRNLWIKIQESINLVLDSVTLDDLVKDYSNLLKNKIINLEV